MKLTATRGDITTIPADAIVNAANSRMRGGGGVDGAIHRAGGPAILQDCIARYPDGLATGDAGATTAGDLPARWVIHTVGPNHAAGQTDPLLLRSCYRRSLAVADELGARSVTFPLVSAGIYGWPLHEAITLAVGELLRGTSAVQHAQLVAFDEATLHKIEQVLQRATPLRLLQGLAVLLHRGYHQLHFLPGLSPSGMHWRISITTTDNLVEHDPFPGYRDEDSVVRYTTGAGAEFDGGRVDAATSPEQAADLILSALGDPLPLGGDPAVVEWMDALMAKVHFPDVLPIASEDDGDPARGWRLGKNYHPPMRTRPTGIVRPPS